MFRLPKNSNQSCAKKIVGSTQNSQGLCKYPYRKCNILCLEKYEYCLKHILEDKSAPYKPCPYAYANSGKKCGKAAHRPDRKETGLCTEHSRKAHLLRQKASTKHAPPQTQEALLASLAHYAPPDSIIAKKEEHENEESATQQSSQAVNPFVEIDAAQINTRCSQVLDYASDSDSDVEVAMLDNVWRAQDHESSDAESVDSQAEDPLKHAGVYTAEEVTIVIKDKMIRLQSLYIDQFRRLHHLLKERRRKYLHGLKKEKETLCSIHDQEKNSSKEQKLYQKLKALNHFHRYYGEEAVLHKKALERRAQATEGTLVRTSHKGKCAFTEGGVKCGAKTLPVTKYCRKHILKDSQQVLFRACGFKRNDHECKEPTLNVFENATCVYHIVLPAQPHNTLDMLGSKEEIKTETESTPNSQENTSIESSSSPVPEENKKPAAPEVEPIKSPESMDLDLTVTRSMSPIKKSETLMTETENSISAVNNQVPEISVAETSNKIKKDTSKSEIETAKSPVKEEQKCGNSTEDLVMVDMMTDVGVVEEVLASEEKQVQEESMQVDPESDTNVDNK